MLLKESFSYNSVSLRLWAILWPFKQWDWHRGPQLCLADDLRKNNWLSTLSNLPKGFVCAGPEARNTPASQILLPHNKLVYLVLGLRKGKKPRRATEKKLNVSGNVSELFCKLLVWDLKKKKRGRRKNTLLPDSNCFTNQVSEAQAQTGLYKRPITSKLYDCSLARITILLCCYLSSSKQPETEISFTDFYCYLLTKTLCLLSYAGEKREYCPVQALEQSSLD